MPLPNLLKNKQLFYKNFVLSIAIEMETHPATREIRRTVEEDSEDELVPIGTTFEFTNTESNLQKNPAKAPAVHFNAENWYGENWIREHSQRWQQWLRNRFIDFAQTVAGMLYSNLDISEALPKVLMTGFEDLRRLEAKNTFDPNFWTQKLPGYEAAKKDQSLWKAWIDKFLNTVDKQLVTQLIEAQVEKEAAVQREWLTQPFNLTSIWFQPTVKAGVDQALTMLQRIYPSFSREVLFNRLVFSDSATDFAVLTVHFCSLAKYFSRPGGKTNHEHRNLTTQINRAYLSLAAASLRIADNMPADIQQSYINSMLPMLINSTNPFDAKTPARQPPAATSYIERLSAVQQ